MSEPISITVDRIFELLNEALGDAVKNHGNASKAFAWDVSGYFKREIGHYRTSSLPSRIAEPPLDAISKGKGE